MNVWVTRESSEEAEETFWDVDPEHARAIQHTANASLCVLLVVAKLTFESQSAPPISERLERLSATVFLAQKCCTVMWFLSGKQAHDFRPT
jgi:hypothetical protein